jgi:hypothetical protein
MTLDQTISQLRAAEQSWHRALTQHWKAPPAAGYTARLRDLANASEAQQLAYEQAADAGLRLTPDEPRERPVPPELAPTSGRPGPPELWQRVDDAFEDLNIALEGTSLAAIAAAYGDVAHAVRAVATAVDGIRIPDPQRKRRAGADTA